MRALSVLLALVVASAAVAADPDKEGFVPMFNGKDLSGWVNVNTHPTTFFVKDDMIVTTGKPTGYLRTDKQYENFIAEFDWMHIPPEPGAVGNSGFFVWADPIPAVGTGYTRGIEVQVLVNLEKKDHYTSQGDLFSIWGAHCKPDRPHPQGWERCLPLENHTKGEREWNHYRVEAKDGRITLAVNGHEVSGVSKCSPRKGYLALESEGSECRFRNLKIKELPSSDPKPEDVAKVAEGHTSLFNGLDLKGWGHWTPPGISEVKGWKADHERLHAGGTTYLSTEKEFGPCELVFDWKMPAKTVNAECVVSVCGKMHTVALPAKAKAGDWHREVIKMANPAGAAPIQFLPKEGLEFMNVFVRELK